MFGIAHAGEFIEESVGRVYVNEVCSEFFSENFYDLFRLALAEKSVVDVYAGELFADGADEQRRDDRRVNAARQREQDFFVADLPFQQFDLVGDEVFGVPVLFGFPFVEDQTAKHVASCFFVFGKFCASFIVETDGRISAVLYSVGDLYALSVLAAVDDNALYSGEFIEFLFFERIGVNFGVNAERSYLSCELRVFVASGVDYKYHILVHKTSSKL